MTTTPSTPAVPRLRANMAGVPAYVAGKPAVARAGLEVFKLSSNENPFPPLPSVLTAIARAAATVNRYPDPTAGAMLAAVATRWGVGVEDLATATGSVRLLAQLAEITCAPGDEVVYAWRAFEAYPITAAIADATAVEVPLTADARHDLPAMLAAITERTRLVILCSPNNPTGPALRRAELERFLAAVPRDVLVVLDEAYREFVDDPEVPDGVELWREHPNLVVLRTFSKAYGLAGLRVGVALAHPEVASTLRRSATPFGVSAIAQAAVVASLQTAAEAELLERVATLVAERNRVVAGLREQGWDVPDAQGNFLWLPVGERAVELAGAFGAEGLAVRPFAGAGIRVTVAETAANDRLLRVAATLLAPGQRAGADVSS
ncbi:histidinol-phosphate transaminase [Kineococcus radiotolerans]|uniref:Aromatic amino acid aminotransferase n=1 Tax=Kineococcus radiotolerans (strain ATCC BAA-149 / DSM 14245 / SRS30216) TaxID=266940 RepID=A6WG15_KINRD|nr:histidinol-phosphate transaminase [Kineococcus radiotolerans]ABS05754.1 histidinol-phosphate aminotransferase [Kineococcus radiotolerans SRS30216 = ATCC BAA-149]